MTRMAHRNSQATQRTVDRLSDLVAGPTDRRPYRGVSSDADPCSLRSYDADMIVQLAKSAVDLGIVVADGARSMAFYCGLLGFEHVGDMAMPIGGGGTMHRVEAGGTLLKLIEFGDTPPPTPGGGMTGGLGFRYLTFIVSNLDEIVSACGDADVPTAVPISEIRPGVRIAMVEDPDGNWVEFVEFA